MPALDFRDARAARPTLAGRLEEQLRADILSGVLAPGERLNLDRMRERLGVSVSSLREAVTRLVADGLVEVVEQKGYRVAPMSLANLDEITRLRTECEPIALRAAIAAGGIDWETQVMAALYRLNRTGRRIDDAASVEAWELAHNAFHTALIAPSRMPVLMRMLRVLHNLNDRYRRIFLSIRLEQRDLVEEHTAIAEAAVARKADQAAALLRDHLGRTGETLRRLLSDRLPEDAE